MGLERYHMPSQPHEFLANRGHLNLWLSYALLPNNGQNAGI